jgi:hypothetical protein
MRLPPHQAKETLLRAFSQFPISFTRVAWLILDCARRTSTFLSCAFREQENGQATLTSFFSIMLVRFCWGRPTLY